jgi:hypothetical protein
MYNKNQLRYKVEIWDHGVFVIHQDSEFYTNGDVPEYWKTWVPASFGFPMKRGKRERDEHQIIKAQKLCRALNIYAENTGDIV